MFYQRGKLLQGMILPSAILTEAVITPLHRKLFPVLKRYGIPLPADPTAWEVDSDPTATLGQIVTKRFWHGNYKFHLSFVDAGPAGLSLTLKISHVSGASVLMQMDGERQIEPLVRKLTPKFIREVYRKIKQDKLPDEFGVFTDKEGNLINNPGSLNVFRVSNLENYVIEFDSALAFGEENLEQFPIVWLRGIAAVVRREPVSPEGISEIEVEAIYQNPDDLMKELKARLKRLPVLSGKPGFTMADALVQVVPAAGFTRTTRAPLAGPVSLAPAAPATSASVTPALLVARSEFSDLLKSVVSRLASSTGSLVWSLPPVDGWKIFSDGSKTPLEHVASAVDAVTGVTLVISVVEDASDSSIFTSASVECLSRSKTLFRESAILLPPGVFNASTLLADKIVAGTAAARSEIFSEMPQLRKDDPIIMRRAWNFMKTRLETAGFDVSAMAADESRLPASLEFQKEISRALMGQTYYDHRMTVRFVSFDGRFGSVSLEIDRRPSGGVYDDQNPFAKILASSQISFEVAINSLDLSGLVSDLMSKLSDPETYPLFSTLLRDLAASVKAAQAAQTAPVAQTAQTSSSSASAFSPATAVDPLTMDTLAEAALSWVRSFGFRMPEISEMAVDRLAPIFPETKEVVRYTWFPVVSGSPVFNRLELTLSQVERGLAGYPDYERYFTFSFAVRSGQDIFVIHSSDQPEADYYCTIPLSSIPDLWKIGVKIRNANDFRWLGLDANEPNVESWFKALARYVNVISAFGIAYAPIFSETVFKGLLAAANSNSLDALKSALAETMSPRQFLDALNRELESEEFLSFYWMSSDEKIFQSIPESDGFDLKRFMSAQSPFADGVASLGEIVSRDPAMSKRVSSLGYVSVEVVTHRTFSSALLTSTESMPSRPTVVTSVKFLGSNNAINFSLSIEFEFVDPDGTLICRESVVHYPKSSDMKQTIRSLASKIRDSFVLKMGADVVFIDRWGWLHPRLFPEYKAASNIRQPSRYLPPITSANLSASQGSASGASSTPITTVQAISYTPTSSLDFVSLPSGLQMTRTEVTNAQWKAVMGSVPSAVVNPYHPVTNVSWDDAQEFCKKTGTRLPTEDEWEYAYRAGTTTDWYNGDDPAKVDEIAWTYANSSGGPHRVGQKLPNAWGLYDMAGNVWEWMGTLAGSGRALRGGAFSSDVTSARSDYRNSGSPSLRNGRIGFRVVKD